ncbi:MAG: 30S ribosomal protein S20 [Micavibrio sp.]|nr:30S ribosomal protein S20 [Micavibrio sp.]HCK33478.1 30S ribosomal protein S20 [Rhodospirillaceae bacterium]|tara:strand:+ start:1246 stop:1512 length:267 start_codon:yes stop_codon:yes gene_type:complete
MANIKSAKKRILTTRKKTEANTARRSRIRTFVKKVDLALEAGNATEAEAALKLAQPEIDRGVSKGVLKKNTAARKMSRLSARVKALKA